MNQQCSCSFEDHAASIPCHYVEQRKTDHREIHNVFGMENVRGTYEGLLKLQPTNARSSSRALPMRARSVTPQPGLATTRPRGITCGFPFPSSLTWDFRAMLS